MPALSVAENPKPAPIILTEEDKLDKTKVEQPIRIVFLVDIGLCSAEKAGL